MSGNSTLIIGIGNPWRCDDGIGAAVVRALPTLPNNVQTLEHHGEGLSLIAAWEGFERVVLIDAIRASARAGLIYRFNAATDELPRGLFHYSSHQFGLAEAVELARELDRLPTELIIYGIVGANFQHGDKLSPAVAAAVTTLSKRITTFSSQHE